MTQAAARVLAATMTLLARERQRLPAPFSLWAEPPSPSEIVEAARAVAADEASVLWVDDVHPARGLMLVRPQPLEGELLGSVSLRLQGPYMVETDPAERGRLAAVLARKAVGLARAGSAGFLSVKTSQDAAVLRGLMSEGFQLAELTARLAGPLDAARIPEYPFERGRGLILSRPESGRFDPESLDELGDLFYDGHRLHGPFLQPDFQGRLWRAVVSRGIAQGRPTLLLIEERTGRMAGLSLVTLGESAAELTALHVTEGRRGEGLGRILLQETVRLLLDVGRRELRVETASWNLPALALYLELGLRPLAPAALLHHRLEPKSAAPRPKTGA
jgi:ribosomal protein S18 acetylase RimI-like enzyme